MSRTLAELARSVYAFMSPRPSLMGAQQLTV